MLWLQDVVLQLRIPDKPARKRKGDASRPAALRRKRKKGWQALADDLKVKQLADGLEMPFEELLEELPAMSADDEPQRWREADI